MLAAAILESCEQIDTALHSVLLNRSRLHTPCTSRADRHPLPHLTAPRWQAAWLLQQAGLDVPNPKDHEEPHSICASLVAAARRLGFAAPSYAPTKLTAGWGREVCALLWALADCAIVRRRLAPGRPVYRQAQGEGQQGGEGGDEAGAEDDEEEVRPLGRC